MTEEQIALARRAVACRGWKWMPGMRTTDAMRVIHDETAFPGRPCAIREGSWVDTSPPRPLTDALPDLTDPATLGCVLALVREAWGDECICTLPVDYGPGGVTWFCRLTAGGRDLAQSYVRGGVGEVEALVAALEAAE